MVSYRYKPPPPLDRFIEVIWVMEAPAAPHSKERLLPDGSVELVFDLGSDRFPIFTNETLTRRETFRDSIVCGPHSQAFGIDTSKGTSVAGVHFKAGGAYPFLKLPFGELHNMHVSLDAFWGRTAATRVRDRLLEALTPQAKAQVLERELLSIAAGRPERHPAVAFALNEFHTTPEAPKICAVSDEIGISSRHFIDIFRNEVGLTPKLFCRIRRFQQVLRQISAGARIQWSNVALEAGYFDQAHFIHDFRAFSGINPSAYLSDYQGHVNHVPVSHSRAKA
ncbi:MAG: AraC family transcriptional regulator [Acidobacteria bacterium]|nr:AraC family transcriptional regulator [Acidobacteriota bacterium]